MAACEWCPGEGTGWNRALGVNVGRGGSISSPSGVPNLLGFGSPVREVS